MLRPTAGTGERQGYATAIADLWSGLSRTLGRLEAIAADPGERLAGEDALETLSRLQYGLHAAGELALGIAPPAGAEAAHADLAAALADARDATAEVLDAVEAGGPQAAAALVHEWRGALFRVRLARMRLASRPVAPSASPTEPDRGRDWAAVASVALVLGGTLAFTNGALLALWPLWVGGLLLVAAAILVYRP